LRKIAVVNSKSFGKFIPEHIQLLETLGQVDFFQFDPAINGIELAEALIDYQCIIASVTPMFDQSFFQNTPNLGLLCRHGLGVDNVDLVAASENQVMVTKVFGKIERQAVAELALALMMNELRKINKGQRLIRNKEWDLRSSCNSFELKHATVGVIGYGNIGTKVGQILHDGFHTQVLVYDPYKSYEEIKKAKGEKVSFAELLSRSDVITLHCNLTDKNRQMLGESEFRLMKPHALLINTARGELVDESALINALARKEISGYAADVFAKEPLDSDHPLLAFENVTLTPHIGAYTSESLAGMGEHVVTNIVRFYEQQEPLDLVNERSWSL
jgi:phosphoglycerate dehydrogenase-like enzyme